MVFWGGVPKQGLQYRLRLKLAAQGEGEAGAAGTQRDDGRGEGEAGGGAAGKGTRGPRVRRVCLVYGIEGTWYRSPEAEARAQSAVTALRYIHTYSKRSIVRNLSFLPASRFLISDQETGGTAS
eukprot:2031996-Prymnesium_polylepis.1